MHRLDFELTSKISQEALRKRLTGGSTGGIWKGRDSEYLGVYTMARFENQAVAKIFQPNRGERFDIEIAAPKEVGDDFLEALKADILDAFSDAKDVQPD
jgi:hypothetical protein